MERRQLASGRESNQDQKTLINEGSTLSPGSAFAFQRRLASLSQDNCLFFQALGRRPFLQAVLLCAAETLFQIPRRKNLSV